MADALSRTTPEPPALVELFRVRVPLRRAHRSVHATVTERESILVRWVRSDGQEGWGECPTLPQAGYATETTDEAWESLRTWVVPAVRSGSADAGRPSRPAARAAVRDAALDAQLRSDHSSAATLFGERSSLPTTSVVALVGADLDEVVAAAVAAAREATAVKVKVVPGSALETARAVLDAIRPVPLALDANGSFDPDPEASDAIELAALVDLPLAYLEQPFAPDVRHDRWATLAAAGVPLAVDESAVSVRSVVAALRAGACRLVSIKPARLGGVLAAAEVAAAAVEAGGECFVGGMFELGVGRSAALRLAVSPMFTTPTDLGPSARYVEVDITEPVLAAPGGEVVVPTGPGLSSPPLPDRLARWTVDRAVAAPG